MTSSPLPVVRLKPKMDPRRIRWGFPWVYDNELVLDRRTKALPAGTLAELQDGDRRPLALVAVNPSSRIFGRVLSRDPSTPIAADWFTRRLTAAHEMRARCFEAPFYRLIHAEADGLPGVIIDRFGDTCVIQPNAAWADVRFDTLAAATLAVTGATSIIKNGTGRARGLEGLPEVTEVTHGSPPPVVDVPMNGAIYKADLLGGQKTGLFFDQRPNHRFFQTLSSRQSVLDVFSHVGGFGLAALAGGAASALCVDGSAPALELAASGASTMGVADRFDSLRGDAFDVMTSLQADGRTFGSVVCDPPAFAPSKQALSAGLRAYEKTARQGALLTAPGGYLTLCSCSHAADLASLREACQRGIGRAGRRAQLIHTGFAGPDHPQMPGLAESGYLKALFYRLLP